MGGAIQPGAFSHGCTMAYGGVGLLDIALDPAVGFAVAGEYLIDVQLRTNGVSQQTVTDTSPQVKRVAFFASAAGAGAAAESAFEFKIWRVLTK